MLRNEWQEDSGQLVAKITLHSPDPEPIEIKFGKEFVISPYSNTSPEEQSQQNFNSNEEICFMSNQYPYSGKNLTPKMARELILQLFSGQTLPKQDIVRKVDEVHVELGG